MNKKIYQDFKDIEIPENIDAYSLRGIELAKEELSNEHNIFKLFWNFIFTKKKQTAYIALICAMFVIGNIFSLTALFKSIKETSIFQFKNPIIKALTEDEDGTSVNSKFFISNLTYKTIDDVAKNLSVTPNENFRIENSNGGYLLTFDNPMQMNKIYNFVFSKGEDEKESYAFQTKQEFMVSSVFPRNEAYSVPLDSGIEITFSQGFSNDYVDYIEISPRIEGEFEVQDNMIIFKPVKFESNTKYTVTIKKGLKSNTGEELKEDYKLSFNTKYVDSNNKNEYIRISGDNVESFLAEDTPVIEIYSSDGYNDVEFTTEVFEIDDYNTYGNLIKEVKEKTDTSSQNNSEYPIFECNEARKIFDFKSKLIVSETIEDYIVLPKTLNEGYYIINITGSLNGKHIRLQKFIQINNLAVYAQTDKNSMLLWVNSTITKQPLSNAQIAFSGKNIGATAEDGTIRFNFEGEKRKEIFVITPNEGKPYVDVVELMPSSKKESYEKYYTYIYTDKSSYLCNEKVRIFGFIKSRDGSGVPSNFKLDINQSQGNYDYIEGKYYRNYSSENSLLSQDINVLPSGAFSVDVQLDNFKSGYYSIDILEENEIIITDDIQVYNYKKPIYKIEYDENNENTLFLNEKTSFKATVSFYDGTPAKGLKFKLDDTEVVTNEKGEISKEIQFNKAEDEYSWYPDYRNITLECLNADNKIDKNYISYIVLPSTVMLTSVVYDENSILIKTNKIVKENISEEFGVYHFYDSMKGDAIDIPVKITLNKITFYKNKKSTKYDYINKINVDSYDVEQIKDEKISEQFIKTVNGEYVLENIKKDERDEDYYYRYYYEAEFKDTNGKTIKEKIYIDESVIYLSGIKNYYFNDDLNKFTYSEFECVENENKRINLYEYIEGKVKSGNILYSIMKEGILEYKYTQNPYFDFSFNKEFIPNCFIGGAYFDGKRIFPIANKRIIYNYKSKKLNISVNPDKQNYEPGDTVNLKINIKDLNNNPRTAAINVSIVDEAVFDVSPQSVDVLEDLYYPYYFNSGLKNELYSYRQHQFACFDAIGGGGDGNPEGEKIRDGFSDNAFFEVVNSDENGNANVSFKLPDNITSWRITTQALTDDICGGENITNIESGLPLFADMILNETALVGDDISINARAFGRGLNIGDDIEFNAKLIDETGNEVEKTLNSKAGDFAGFNFGKLDEGKYKMQLGVNSNGFSDILEKPFMVVQNSAELNLTSTFNLNEGIDVDALKSPLDISIYNKDSRLANSTLLNLYYSNYERNDQKLARIIAGNLLKELSTEEDKQYINTEDIAEGEYQLDNGGFAIYSYASDDPLLTAKAVLAEPESINSVRAINYFNKITDNREETNRIKIASAYFGLAYYKQPVLNEIKAMYKETNSNEYKLRLILACAMIAIGDDISANEIFNSTFREKIKEYDDNTAQIVISKDTKENQEITALSLIVLSKTNKALGDKILSHMVYHEDGYIYDFFGLEQLIYIINTQKTKGTQTIVEYTQNGEKKKFELNNAQVKKLSMTKEQLKEADFKVLRGDADVTVNFIGNASTLDLSTAKLKVTKTIELIDKTDSIINVGDDLRITIKVEHEGKKENFYEFTDFIPSGMRYVKFESNDYKNLIENEEQRVRAYDFTSSYAKIETNQISYIVRAVTEGEYVNDNAFVVGNSYNEWGFSDKGIIKIEKMAN